LGSGGGSDSESSSGDKVKWSIIKTKMTHSVVLRWFDKKNINFAIYIQDKVASANEDDDDEWEKCQSKLAKNKERALEGKSKISHPVHCPYYSDVSNQ
jgi:hypothetical protein